MSAIYQQLLDAVTEKEQIRRAKLYLQELNTRLVSDLRDIKGLEQFISVQEKKVTNLSQNTLSSKWHSWLGDYEEKLTAEQNDYLRAWSRYKDLQESARLTQYEIDLLNVKVARESEVEKNIEQLYQKRADEIKASGTPLGVQLQDIENKLYDCQRDKTQYKEALEAGYKSTDLLKVIYQHLDYAMNTNAKEKDKTTWSLDVARYQINMLSNQLRLFTKELADVNFSFPHNPTMELDSIDLRPTSFFFSDLILGHSIAKAKDHVLRILRLTKLFTDDLEVMYQRVKDELDRWQKEKDKVVYKSD